jgi:hypothetical protein
MKGFPSTICHSFRKQGRRTAAAAMLGFAILSAGLLRGSAAGNDQVQPPDQSILIEDPGAAAIAFADGVDGSFVEEVSDDTSLPSSGDERSWFLLRDRLTVGAEYLLLRPTFSNATAVYQSTISGGNTLANTALNYDFGYASGVRGFIGYRLNEDWMLRFGYLTIDASSPTVGGVCNSPLTSGNGTAFFGPYNTSAAVAGQSIRSTAGVQLDVYDLEVAGRINPDRCGPANGGSRWEAATAIGLRFADVGVSTNVFNDQSALGQQNTIFLTTARGFSGIGPRLALQGRRYLGADARWSVFGSGAAALLVGGVQNVDTRVNTQDSLTNVQSQTAGGNLVIPNFDITLGATWQMTQRTSFSAGWMLMYWGQLGYSETIPTGVASVGPDRVPLTSSSLSYDGAFFRLTHNF